MANLSYNAGWGGVLGLMAGSVYLLAGSLRNLNNKVFAATLPALFFAATATLLSRVGFAPDANFSGFLHESETMALEAADWGECQSNIDGDSVSDECIDFLMDNPMKFIGMVENGGTESFSSYMPNDAAYIFAVTMLVLFISLGRLTFRQITNRIVSVAKVQR